MDLFTRSRTDVSTKQNKMGGVLGLIELWRADFYRCTIKINHRLIGGGGLANLLSTMFP